MIKCKLEFLGGELKLIITQGNQCKVCKVTIPQSGILTDVSLTNVIDDNGILKFIMSNGNIYSVSLINFLTSSALNDVGNLLQIDVNGKISVIADETIQDAFNVPIFKAFSL